MALSPERDQGVDKALLARLSAEHDTSPRAIRTLLEKGIPEHELDELFEIRGFLSRDGVSITGRGNRNNDIVSVSSIAEAYRAVNGEIDDLRRLAELTLRHITSRTIFMRGAFTRALLFTVEQYRACGQNIQKLEDSFEDGIINPFPDVLQLDIPNDDDKESPLSSS